MVYTVTLNPALDYVMKLKALRTDDINRTDGEEIYYGGKGINVSVILTQLGIPNTALGFLGGFTGKKLEEMLKNDNVSCDFNYLKNGDTRINVKIKADKEIDLNACGPEITKEDMQSFLKKLDSIKSGDYLQYLRTLLQKGSDTELHSAKTEMQPVPSHGNSMQSL